MDIVGSMTVVTATGDVIVARRADGVSVRAKWPARGRRDGEMVGIAELRPGDAITALEAGAGALRVGPTAIERYTVDGWREGSGSRDSAVLPARNDSVR